MLKIYDVIFIGAGVSTCFALLDVNEKFNVLVIDNNKDILTKFMITGKGKSNIANTSHTSVFLSNLIDSNKFLYPSLERYNGKEILSLLDSFKLNYYEKEPNRFHLESNNEKFRKCILSQIAKNKNIEIKLSTKVETAKKLENGLFEVETKNQKFYSKRLIVASGGLSFKKLGATDVGYKIAKSFQHDVIDQYPIGVGLYVDEIVKHNLQGISLDNVRVKVYWNNKIKHEEIGPLIFTHYGIGGPVIRRVSGYVSKYLQSNNECKIEINYLNKYNIIEQINSQHFLSKCFSDFNKNVFSYLIKDYDKNLDLFNVDKKTKNKLINDLTSKTYNIKKTDSIDVAINTGGGVSIKQINPNNMESKLVKNLYFIGEVLDINPRTNGYNITTCFATSKKCINEINKES